MGECLSVYRIIPSGHPRAFNSRYPAYLSFQSFKNGIVDTYTKEHNKKILEPIFFFFPRQQIVRTLSTSRSCFDLIGRVFFFFFLGVKFLPFFFVPKV